MAPTALAHCCTIFLGHLGIEIYTYDRHRNQNININVSMHKRKLDGPQALRFNLQKASRRCEFESGGDLMRGGGSGEREGTREREENGRGGKGRDRLGLGRL